MNLWDGARARPCGDGAVVLEYGEEIDPAVHDRVLAADAALAAAGLPWLEEVVPSYRSLLLRFDPLEIAPGDVLDAVHAVEPTPDGSGRRTVEIPWTPVEGPDLDHVARHAGWSTTELVDRLGAGPLRVYLVGFAPGFTYLGGLPPELDLPRRSTPRDPVDPGAVLVAAGQAALCPVAMPTGWWVVGHTSVTLFDVTETPPARLRAGDRVRLVAA